MLSLKHLAAAALLALSTICAAEPGVTDTTVTLGMSAPFSGPNGAYGEDMRQTIQAYFGQLNGTTTQNLNSTVSGTSRNIVKYNGTYTVKNVPSVNGPNLTTSNDTCMGSSSGSANGPGFGVSFGTTWSDDHCKRLKMSRELWNKGMKAASLAMDCMDPAARVALEITGSKCPQSMTADERRSNYGANASAEGSVAMLPEQQTASSTPVSQASELQPGSTSALYPN